MSKQKELGISDETMKKMTEFFMKTSMPRILKDIEKKKEVKQ